LKVAKASTDNDSSVGKNKSGLLINNNYRTVKAKTPTLDESENLDNKLEEEAELLHVDFVHPEQDL